MLLITVIGGILLALLIDQPIWGQGIVRILVISPFFVMPPVAALVWKNMFMNPGYGLFGGPRARLGPAADRLVRTDYPLFSIILIVAWQWLPFATLILLTALQSLDIEQKEAAEMDGAGFLSRFWYMTLPHLARAITVVVLIQTIFLLGVYAEILVTTNGGPGYASTNLPFLVYQKALLEYDVGQASAGGIVAVILANIVAFFADARGRQEPRRVGGDHGPRRHHPAQGDRHRRRLDRRPAHLLPDPLHDPHLLQVRAGGDPGLQPDPVGHAGELRARSSRSTTTSSPS